MTRQQVTTYYIVAVMVVLLFIAYMSFTVPLPTRAPDEQSALYDNVPTAIPGPPPNASAVSEGEALAYMQIPRFGESWLWTTLEGVDEAVVNQGPGHYPGTVLPGEEGNSAFAAHRATHGDPFIDFDKLVPGDKVILSQSGARWTYEVSMAPQIIASDAHWVLDNFAPGRWLTLTTCWPKYGSEKRMFVRAELVSAETIKE